MILMLDKHDDHDKHDDRDNHDYLDDEMGGWRCRWPSLGFNCSIGLKSLPPMQVAIIMIISISINISISISVSILDTYV